MISRNVLIMIGIAAVAGLAIGSLLGIYTANQMAQSREAELKAEIEKLRAQLGLLNIEDTVLIYSWSWYIHPDLIDLFKETYGVKNVIYNTFESDEEVLTKVSTGASGYDVVMMADAFAGEAVRDGFLETLDLKLIPNLEHIDNRFRNQAYDPGNQYSVPYMWGTTGIGYDSSLVTDPVTGWAQMFDDSPGGFLEKYNGKITMLDDLYETIGAALVYLGYSPNDSDSAHLEQAKNLLIAQKRHLCKYAGADMYIPNMVNPQSTNFWISHVWNGDLYTSKENNPNLRYVLPEEGGIWWIDNMVIPKGAPHPVAAHAWINFMSDPMVAAINSEKIHYASPNKYANEKLLPKSVISDRNLYPSEEDLQKFELGKIFSEEERLRFEDVWTQVKAAT